LHDFGSKAWVKTGHFSECLAVSATQSIKQVNLLRDAKSEVFMGWKLTTGKARVGDIRGWIMWGMVLFTLVLPGVVFAAQSGDASKIDLTTSWVGIMSVVIFVIAYAVVMGEEFLHLRKSKPVLVAAGLIWAMIGIAFSQAGDHHTAEHAVRHNILEYAELMLFLLAAMTYINTMEERGIFDALRVWLVTKGFSLRQIFWITGVLAFFISPIADNLTTALLMGAVVLSVGKGNNRFCALGCLNIVIAANAGGAFSPFGDITTLMVWQKGIISFTGFFAIFLPSLTAWTVPALIMNFTIGSDKPAEVTEETQMGKGAFVVVALFICTIASAVSFHNFLHLPPVLGMMTGLGVLKLYGYYLKRTYHRTVDSSNPFEAVSHKGAETEPFDIFKRLEKAEWDTLMFFYGVILCVGGLGTIGYLAMVSEIAYVGYGPTFANVMVGILSAIVDNIPVMFAVLTMQPVMNEGHWMLVTLTAGVGGSMLSIGSAAGVALMGQARGIYTFFGHLKWTWAVALGYVASIGVHFLVNASALETAPLGVKDGPCFANLACSGELVCKEQEAGLICVDENPEAEKAAEAPKAAPVKKVEAAPPPAAPATEGKAGAADANGEADAKPTAVDAKPAAAGDAPPADAKPAAAGDAAPADK
jgi:NhaD family Na+/H+ antiporter